MIKLPGHARLTNPATYIERALASSRLMHAKQGQYANAFPAFVARHFRSPAATSIFVDSFWWLWLQRYGRTAFGPGAKAKIRSAEEAQAGLFARLALEYVNLFEQVDSPKHRDAFFQITMFPDLLSQAIYSAFFTIFMDSCSELGPAFKSFICCTVTEWMSGILPMPRTWMQWPLASLEIPIPEEFEDHHQGHHQGHHQDQGLSPNVLLADQPQSAAVPCGKSELPQELFVELTRPETVLKTFAEDRIESHKVIFDIHGHTPLFTKYLELKGMKTTNHIAVMTTRTQLIARDGRE